MQESEKANYRENRIVALFLFVALMAFSPSRGWADTLCQISDPKDPTLNVRKSPGGPVVNRLQNERVVRVDNTNNDATGRTWVEVSGINRGEWRNWGWVFRDHLRCIDTDKFPKERLSVAALKAVGIVPQNAE